MNLEINPAAEVSALNRRQASARIAVALGSLLAGSRAGAQPQQPAMQEKQATEDHKALTALHYDINFKASPQRIYEALLDAKQFAAFSGMTAEIDARPGGAFNMFGGQIVGRNIELVGNRRIVQAWRPAHWDAGVYSIARFELKQRGSESALAFDHSGFPAGEYDQLDWGWHHHYWEPLKKFLV